VTWLTFGRLKVLSFTHSAIYTALLVVWLVPGLHTAEMVFGFAHGIGWIVMCVLSLEALRRHVIDLRLAVAISVIGAVGPFVGSYEFVRQSRRRRLPTPEVPAPAAGRPLQAASRAANGPETGR
jgi:hypothetical protein